MELRVYLGRDSINGEAPVPSRAFQGTKRRAERSWPGYSPTRRASNAPNGRDLVANPSRSSSPATHASRRPRPGGATDAAGRVVPGVGGHGGEPRTRPPQTLGAGGPPDWSGVRSLVRVEPSSRDGRSLSFNLRGMNERVRLEVLYGLQVAIDESRNVRGSGVAGRSASSARTTPRACWISLATTLSWPETWRRGCCASPSAISRRRGRSDAEAAKDVWNLRVFGFSGALDFSPLSQRRLRETAKQWVLVMLPTPWAKGSRVGERIAALEVLSSSLASRPDGGVNHRLLGRADIVAFKNRVALLPPPGLSRVINIPG